MTMPKGELVKSYFVPNGSYLMELAEDGSSAAQVQVLQMIGKAIGHDLKADAIVVALHIGNPRAHFLLIAGASTNRSTTTFFDHAVRPQVYNTCCRVLLNWQRR